jgi:hypothetical protein
MSKVESPEYKRFKEFLRYANLNLKRMSQLAQVAVNTLYLIKHNGYPTESKLIYYIEQNYPEINIEYLRFGKGTLIKTIEQLGVQKGTANSTVNESQVLYITAQHDVIAVLRKEIDTLEQFKQQLLDDKKRLLEQLEACKKKNKM